MVFRRHRLNSQNELCTKSADDFKPDARGRVALISRNALASGCPPLTVG
jgi:hypothetical protein